MTKTHRSRQIQQLLLCPENLRAETISLPGVDFSTLPTCSYATGVLSTVLEDRQSIVDVFNRYAGWVGEDDCDNAAHVELR